ncbi:hypothetical protein VNO77_04863 [Canavalia gladiata]|uniref:Uncharacterized protein n=1 Tax=Canavalia gladiata TaxID=3824 RepID=A0AAN9MXX3_CANGL
MNIKVAHQPWSVAEIGGKEKGIYVKDIYTFSGVFEARPLPLSIETHATNSDFPSGGDGIFIVVSGLKGMDKLQHKPNRLSPMGPDPRHH